MKLLIPSLLLSVFVAYCLSAEEQRPPARKPAGTNSSADRLIRKYDSDGDGFINLSERPGFVRERNRERINPKHPNTLI
jgi:hypothetical protein